MSATDVTTATPPQAPVDTVPAASSLASLPVQDIKIIKRKLNGYVGFANLPKQWHRKSVRRGFLLNLMAVGELGLIEAIRV